MVVTIPKLCVRGFLRIPPRANGTETRDTWWYTDDICILYNRNIPQCCSLMFIGDTLESATRIYIVYCTSHIWPVTKTSPSSGVTKGRDDDTSPGLKTRGDKPGWSTHDWQLWVGGGPLDLCLWYRIFRHEHPFTRYSVDFEPIATWLHPEGDIHFFSPNCLYCSCTEVLKNICQL